MRATTFIKAWHLSICNLLIIRQFKRAWFQACQILRELGTSYFVTIYI